MVQIWYPAEEKGEGKRAPYISEWRRKNPNQVSLEQLDEYFHTLVNGNIFEIKEKE